MAASMKSGYRRPEEKIAIDPRSTVCTETESFLTTASLLWALKEATEQRMLTRSSSFFFISLRAATCSPRRHGRKCLAVVADMSESESSCPVSDTIERSPVVLIHNLMCCGQRPV